MSIRERIITDAEGWIGTGEQPPKSNRTPFGEWFGVDGVAWCAMFVSYIYHFAGKTLSDQIEKEKGKYPGFKYVPYMYQWAKKNMKLTADPKPGDIVLIDFEGDGLFDHTAIFVKWSAPGKIETIEGNTSADHRGSQDNGDGVYRRIRNASICKFVNVID